MLASRRLSSRSWPATVRQSCPAPIRTLAKANCLKGWNHFRRFDLCADCFRFCRANRNPTVANEIFLIRSGYGASQLTVHIETTRVEGPIRGLAGVEPLTGQ